MITPTGNGGGAVHMQLQFLFLRIENWMSVLYLGFVSIVLSDVTTVLLFDLLAVFIIKVVFFVQLEQRYGPTR